MPGTHALLSPSAASRWLACSPSARLEAGIPECTSDYADEGTVAHEISKFIIKQKNGEELTAKDQAELVELYGSDYYCDEMESIVEDYSNFVIETLNDARRKTKDALLLSESKIDLTKYIPESFGRMDNSIVADSLLTIIDLKYGKGVPVAAKGNKQMKVYALGILEEVDHLYNIKKVRMVIYQPRIDSITEDIITVSDLKKWAENILIPGAKKAFEGKGEFVAGDHCRFCRAKPKCRALADYNLELAKMEFKAGPLLTDLEIVEVLKKSLEFDNWIKSVKEHALDQAVNHEKKWPGMKLVEGKSNHCYTDETKVSAKLLSSGFTEDVIFEKKLLGITKMTKAIKPKVFDSLLTPFIIKPSGKPALVIIDDPRPELNSLQKAMDDFDIL